MEADSAAAAPRYSAVIATWNAGSVLGPCLDGLETQRLDAPLETIVVDDASTDGTPAILRARGSRVRVIRNESNAGFAAANNQGVRAARGEILFLLNADTVLLHPEALQLLATALADPRVGLVGPRLENPDGTLQPSCVGEPTALRSLAVAAGVHHLLPDAAVAWLHPPVWSHDHPRSTGWLTGAALAIRTAVFNKVGGFWPLLYGEDADLALKVRGLGLDVRLVPAARVLHLGGHSTAQRWSEARRSALVARSELALLSAHRGPARATAIRVFTGLGYAGRALGLRAAGHGGPARRYAAMARVYLGASTTVRP